MDEKYHGNSIEFYSHVKNRSKLGHKTKSFYNGIVEIYGYNAKDSFQMSKAT